MYHLGADVYRITPLNSALFLEVTNNNSGLQVQQDWNSTDPAQRWTLLPVTNGVYAIQNQASGKVLDITSAMPQTQRPNRCYSSIAQCSEAPSHFVHTENSPFESYTTTREIGVDTDL